MDMCNLNSNPNHECKNDENGPQPMKITGLNDDCLVKIFKDLDLESLFNVAVANQWLRPAARHVYKRRFGGNRVDIIGDGYSSTPLENCKSIISVAGLKMCLQYLRCFGPSIIDLVVRYAEWNDVRCEHIHFYINKYCTESLKMDYVYGQTERFDSTL